MESPQRVRAKRVVMSCMLCVAVLSVFTGGRRFPVRETPPEPYPRSSHVTGVAFDLTTLIQAAPGSDLWPNTWAEDDNIYTTWGDGGGFGGMNGLGRVSTGVGRISGNPPGIYQNINGGYRPLYPASFDCATHSDCGKLGDIVAYGRQLYSWLNTQNRKWAEKEKPDIRLARSDDYGKTWTTSLWVFSGVGPDVFIPGTFLQMGRGYADNDGYAYVLGGSASDAESLYLFRVPVGEIMNQSAYEYYGSRDPDNPSWGPMNEMKPVFRDANGIAEEGGVRTVGFVYSRHLNRYLLVEAYGTSEKIGIFEALHPWGPWKTVAYYGNWLGLADEGSGGEALFINFSNKWSGWNPDGSVYHWMIFSCYDCASAYDDCFNAIRATFRLQEGKNS